jgi:hypothetical protein
LADFFRIKDLLAGFPALGPLISSGQFAEFHPEKSGKIFGSTTSNPGRGRPEAPAAPPQATLDDKKRAAELARG